MSTYDRDLFGALQSQFFEGVLHDMGDSAPIFSSLAMTFPVVGSRIDWRRMPGAVELSEGDDELQSIKFVQFFEEMRSRFNLTGLVTYVGDSATDHAIKGPLEVIQEALPALLEIPQHHYFVGPDYSWCLCLTMEGEMGFARRDFLRGGLHNPGLPTVM